MNYLTTKSYRPVNLMSDMDRVFNQFFETAAAQFVTDQAEKLLVPGLDNLRECLSREPTRRARWPASRSMAPNVACCDRPAG